MSFVRCCLGVLLLSTLPFHAALARGETLGIPITIEPRYLDRGVGQALGLGDDGRGVLAESPCNQVELSDPRTRPAGQALEVELALTAHTGVELMGACRGPKPWQGRMIILLEPAVDISGLAVKFTPTDARLIRGDGKEGLFTKPVWALSQSLILPQLGLVRVDLSASLAAIDSLISELLDPAVGAVAPLVERTRIRELTVVPAGLRATLGITVAPRGAPPPEEPPLDPAELDAWTTLEDELDGFLTTVIATLAEATESPDLRQELLGVLLDTRYAIAQALAENQPGQDPVRALFIDAWDRLRPHLSALDASDLPQLESDLRLAGFIAGGDALRALDALGPEYGIEITRDGLRRLARLLLAEGAPASFHAPAARRGRTPAAPVSPRRRPRHRPTAAGGGTPGTLVDTGGARQWRSGDRLPGTDPGAIADLPGTDRSLARFSEPAPAGQRQSDSRAAAGTIRPAGAGDRLERILLAPVRGQSETAAGAQITHRRPGHHADQRPGVAGSLRPGPAGR